MIEVYEPRCNVSYYHHYLPLSVPHRDRWRWKQFEYRWMHKPSGKEGVHVIFIQGSPNDASRLLACLIEWWNYPGNPDRDWHCERK